MQFTQEAREAAASFHPLYKGDDIEVSYTHSIGLAHSHELVGRIVASNMWDGTNRPVNGSRFFVKTTGMWSEFSDRGFFDTVEEAIQAARDIFYQEWNPVPQH